MHRLPRLLIFFALFVILVVAGVLDQQRRYPTSFASRLPVDGRPYFWAGVNYPWKSAQDFGTGAWGYSGIAEPTTYAEVDADFANLAASGVRVVKWRVFNDGRYSPEVDAQGWPAGLDDRFYADVDAALQLAEEHDLYLVFTLFSSGFWTTDCVQRDVHLGGHAETLRDPAKRQALIDRAVVPFLRHVGQHDRLLAVEIIAEPEWGIVELHHEQDNRIKVPLADVQAFVRDVASATHQHTRALATVEANRASNMVHWRGLGLDYYSFSWYDWLEQWEPLDRPAASFGLDRPIVLGEFPSVGSIYHSLAEVYAIAFQQGYAGAFAWSYGNTDRYSKWQEAVDGYRQWVRANWPLVRLAPDFPSPPEHVELRPPPYQFTNVQVIAGRDALWLQADVRVKEPGTYRLQWFLYDAAQTPGNARDEQTLSFDEETRRLSVRLGTFTGDRPYKVSLGIFDDNYQLVKWFEGLAVVRLEDGVPRLVQQAPEDPCGRQIEPDHERDPNLGFRESGDSANLPLGA